MRNIDKYEKEIKEIIEKKETAIAIDKNLNKLKCCSNIACSDCLFNTNGTMICAYNAVKWLMKEYKEPPILEESEKRYLENVIRPFKDRIIYVAKDECVKTYENPNAKIYECIYIMYKDSSKKQNPFYMGFPCFEKGTMYKGMELGKRYTLKGLGLCEGEKCKE